MSRAAHRVLVTISQDYLDGYHAGKDLFKIFDPIHYYRWFNSQDYRDGYEKSLYNLPNKGKH